MDKEDYLRTRTVAEFIEWIDSVEQNRITTGQSDAYRAREGLWKKYADEAQPLGRLLRRNADIPRTATVTMGIQTDLPDASLTTPAETIPIEVTTTDHPGAVHNRRQLNDHDFGPGETNAITTGRDLAVQHARGNPRDFGQVMNAEQMGLQELERLVDRISKKQKKTYPNPPLLIVDSCSSSLEDMEVEEVADYLKKNVTTSPGQFREIWICICSGRVFRL